MTYPFSSSSGTTLTLTPDGTRIVTAADSTFGLKTNDFNVRSFHSNVVLRWEWRPGSTKSTSVTTMC